MHLIQSSGSNSPILSLNARSILSFSFTRPAPLSLAGFESIKLLFFSGSIPAIAKAYQYMIMILYPGSLSLVWEQIGKRAIHSYGASLELVGGEGKEGDLDRGVKEIGVKRKRNHFEEGHGVDKGWTKDQEMALQRAYFSAKPTLLFWKKVAKLVPGKSAKDCFNKLHSDHSTPPQPRPRWRSRKTNSPSYSLLTSTLLKPEEPITEKPSRRKQSRHLAQKTVRQLLQKHHNVDQNYEADLFSVLESTMIL